MSQENELTYEFLWSILDYNSETGIFTWKHRGDVPKEWNTKHALKQAGCTQTRKRTKYILLHIGRKAYWAHRIAFLMHNWYIDKSMQIDHIDGCGTNNAIKNIRQVTKQDNAKNLPISVINTSGRTGVHFAKNENKWRAQIRYNGKQLSLGYFVNIEDSVAKRKEAEIMYGFHENHGRK